MRKNTCGNKEACPPAPLCNVAKPSHIDCFVDSAYPGYYEAKVPRVVAFLALQVDLETEHKLPVPARELKSIRKNVHITQCRVIPFSSPLKLFIAGFVHKNIQFVDSCSGFVRDFATDVPFECTFRLDGIFEDFDSSSKNALGDFSNQYIELAKNGMEGNRCITGGFTFEFFNEPVECELDYAFTQELDILENFNNFGNFNRIKEKLDIVLGITLIRKDIAHDINFYSGTCADTSDAKAKGQGFRMHYERMRAMVQQMKRS